MEASAGRLLITDSSFVSSFSKANIVVVVFHVFTSDPFLISWLLFG